MAGRNSFPKAAGAGQKSCAESTVKMKYSLCGLVGWMEKLGAGTGTEVGCDGGLGNSLGQAARAAPAQIRVGAGEIGNEEIWPRPGGAWQRLAA